MIEASQWRERARRQAITQFRAAWEQAPAAGRAALVAQAERDRVGHRWETGSHACVLALLVKPALRSAETPKMAAYRLFGCEVTDDFPVTWDAAGVSLDELLASVGVAVPHRAGLWGRLRRLAPAAAGG